MNNAGRILVTGANGFAGAAIVDSLLQAGLPVTATVRSAAGYRAPSGVRVVETGDIGVDVDWSRALCGVTCIIHCAGLAHMAGGANTNEAQFRKVNTEGTDRLTSEAATHGVQTFINISSIGAITANASVEVITDQSPERPVTTYGRSKLAAEVHVASFGTGGRAGISLRPPLIAGANARGNWGALQKLALTEWPLPLASVHNQRSILNIANLAGACLHLARGTWGSDKTGSYALADETPLSLARMLVLLREGMGRPARLFGFPPSMLHLAFALIGRRQQADGLLSSLVIDSSRFCRSFGWQQTVHAEEGILQSGRDYISGNSNR